MVDYMEESESGEGYASQPYNLATHNCGTYGCEVINQAMPWYRKVTGSFWNGFPKAANAVAGSIMGIGHAIEQGNPKHIIQGITGATGSMGRADMHGYSLPWGSKRASYTKGK